MNRQADKCTKRQRRHRHVRKKVFGTPDRPRLTVFRSLRNIYAQVIDDTAGRTLASASTVSPDMLEDLGGGAGNIAAAQAVGKRLAEKALVRGVRSVVFDRGGFKYHGRVKALADAAREAGLVF